MLSLNQRTFAGLTIIDHVQTFDAVVPLAHPPLLPRVNPSANDRPSLKRDRPVQTTPSAPHSHSPCHPGAVPNDSADTAQLYSIANYSPVAYPNGEPVESDRDSTHHKPTRNAGKHPSPLPSPVRQIYSAPVVHQRIFWGFSYNSHRDSLS
jgi:hypothetical protein